MLDSIGWVATAVFTSSYFFREQAVLRRIQAAAACLWMAYGLAIGAGPIIAANLIVAVAAIGSSFNQPLPLVAARKRLRAFANSRITRIQRQQTRYGSRYGRPL